MANTSTPWAARIAPRRTSVAAGEEVATAFKAKIGDVEFTVAPAVGVADTGSLEYDLPDLFLAVAETML